MESEYLLISSSEPKDEMTHKMRLTSSQFVSHLQLSNATIVTQLKIHRKVKYVNKSYIDFDTAIKTKTHLLIELAKRTKNLIIDLKAMDFNNSNMSMFKKLNFITKHYGINHIFLRIKGKGVNSYFLKILKTFFHFPLTLNIYIDFDTTSPPLLRDVTLIGNNLLRRRNLGVLQLNVWRNFESNRVDFTKQLIYQLIPQFTQINSQHKRLNFCFHMKEITSILVVVVSLLYWTYFVDSILNNPTFVLLLSFGEKMNIHKIDFSFKNKRIKFNGIIKNKQLYGELLTVLIMVLMFVGLIY